MFEMELLHVRAGDKKKKYDTSDKATREKLQTEIREMVKAGTAVFLELDGDTLRVKDYDAETNKLVLQVDKGEAKKEVSAENAKTVAVPPVSGG
jgi:hypothetical protein